MKDDIKGILKIMSTQKAQKQNKKSREPVNILTRMAETPMRWPGYEDFYNTQ